MIGTGIWEATTQHAHFGSFSHKIMTFNHAWFWKNTLNWFGYWLNWVLNYCVYIISDTGMSQPYRIDIFEDLIYGTNLKHEVFRVHKYGKQPVELLDPAIEKATHVMIVHRFKQQDGKIFFVFPSQKKISPLSYVIHRGWWMNLEFIKRLECSWKSVLQLYEVSIEWHFPKRQLVKQIIILSISSFCDYI